MACSHLQANMAGLPIHTTVLRLGYRVGRDPRITTHLGLVARALGADAFLVAGDKDLGLFKTLTQVGDAFGGEMHVDHVASPTAWVKEFISAGEGDGPSGIAVHLTMYGEDYREVAQKLPRDKPVVVIVGGPKVPQSIYRMSQFNVAVGNQPHSEVAALALLLDRLQDGSWVDQKFEGARLEIIPNADGKTVIDRSDGEGEGEE